MGQAPNRRLVRTPVTGVYQRGNRYVAVWDEDGKQHKRFCSTFDEAVRFKGEQRDRSAARREEATRKRREQEAGIQRPPKPGSVDRAYALVRKAAQELERAEMTRAQSRAAKLAFGALYEAEDALIHTSKERLSA